jgi:uncharacterized protein YjiS (DUF1127 family)
MAQRTRTRSGRWFGLQRALALPLRELWQRLRADRQRRRIERDTRAELLGLDGRMLRDLGLDRGQIPRIARAVAGHGHAVHVAASRGIGAED